MQYLNHKYLYIVLATILSFSTASAGEHPPCQPEQSLWQKTKIYSSDLWQETKAFSSDTWKSTQQFIAKDDNESWLYVTGGGAGIAAGGASAITTTSLLGITIVSSPAWAPVAICAGGAVAAVGLVHLIQEDANE